MLENVLTLRLDPVACNSYIEQIHLQHGLVSFKRFSRLDQSFIPSHHSERSLPPSVNREVRRNRERITESVTPTYRTKPKVSSVTIDLSPIQQSTSTPPPQETVHIQNLKDESINTSTSLRQSEPFMRIRETIVYKKMEERPLDDFSSMGKSSISTEMTYTQRNSKMESFIGSNWSLFETPRVSVALRNTSSQNQRVVDKSPLFESKWTSQNKFEPPQQRSEIFKKHTDETDKENNNTSNFQSPELPKQTHATIKIMSQPPVESDIKKPDNNRIQISTKICRRIFDKEAETTPKSTHVIQEVSSDLASVGLKEAVSFYVDESTTPLKDDKSPSSNLLNKNCLDVRENVNHSFTPFTITFRPNATQQPVETVTVKTFYTTPQDSAVMMSLRNSSASQISLRTSSISDFRSQSNMVKRVTETMSDGSIYEGDMFGYMKQGRGKLTYPDGKYYEGEWKIGRINGQGTFYNRDGSVIYDGQWKNDKSHGKGVFYNPDKKSCFDEIVSENLKLKKRSDQTWVKYEGNFQDGMWEGTGDLSFTNGDRYIGDFKKDKIEGRGVFVGINGKIIEGAWKDHCFIESLY